MSNIGMEQLTKLLSDLGLNLGDLSSQGALTVLLPPPEVVKSIGEMIGKSAMMGASPSSTLLDTVKGYIFKGELPKDSTTVTTLFNNTPLKIEVKSDGIYAGGAKIDTDSAKTFGNITLYQLDGLLVPGSSGPKVSGYLDQPHADSVPPPKRQVTPTTVVPVQPLQPIYVSEGSSWSWLFWLLIIIIIIVVIVYYYRKNNRGVIRNTNSGSLTFL